MFGSKKPINATINTRVDHVANFKRIVDMACSEAEAAGVRVAAIHELFKGLTENYRQRSLYEADRANARSQIPTDAVARAQAVRAARAARQLEAERQEYRAAVNRAADAEDARRGR